ncbi:MAG TPA: amino acid permease [Phycisphaerales bacterium]|nr:amino acid permease [Phycisphaerales bacterium]
MPSPDQTAVKEPTRFGTFGGVFTTCVLTILGVIMFLRFGEVVGNAGVLSTIVIVLAAKVITTLTTLSLSAIATNTRTKAGGAYFLISRSLGVEFGGTIGLVFFLAQAISVAMYVIGFSEAFVTAFANLKLSLLMVGTITNIIVFACVYIGAGWTIKLQYGILAILVASLLSFYAGAAGQWSTDLLQTNMTSSYETGQGWITMFALFFPAVTGVMAGANMSGDLKDPAKSIPSGTLLAVGFTALIYLTLPIVLGAVASRETLQTSNMIMGDVALIPWLITAGVFAATLSSALGSMMGSPRILQAFARDQVLPVLRPFAKGSGVSSEPRRATILTFIIAQSCLLLGDLNAIAPIITMAFMITYGTLNLASFYESFTKNPSYRPRFRFCHWSLSLLGAILCLVVMIVISWIWAIAAIIGMAGLYWLINQREIKANWGDLKSGIAFERARKNLSILEDELYHPKNWRPMLLTMSGAGKSRKHLAIIGHWLTAGHGIQTLGQVLPGDITEHMDRRKNQREVLRTFIKENELSAFPAVVVSESVRQGILSLVQAHGLGGLEPNTVLLGWPNQEDRGPEFARLLRTVAGLNRSLILVRSENEDEELWSPPSGPIDVWWRGRSNGPLMLMLAFLLTKNHGWRNRTIRLLRIVPNEAAKEEVQRHLSELAQSARIPAEIRIFVAEDAVSKIKKVSSDSAVVFMGFEPPENADADELFYLNTERLIDGLPRVILVDDAGSIELES